MASPGTAGQRADGSKVVFRIGYGVALGAFVFLLPISLTAAFRALPIVCAVAVAVAGVAWALHRMTRLGLLNVFTAAVTTLGLAAASQEEPNLGIGVAGVAGLISLGIWTVFFLRRRSNRSDRWWRQWWLPPLAVIISLLVLAQFAAGAAALMFWLVLTAGLGAGIGALLPRSETRPPRWWLNPKWWVVPVLAIAGLALMSPIADWRFQAAQGDLTVYANQALTTPVGSPSSGACQNLTPPTRIATYTVTTVCVMDREERVVEITTDDSGRYRYQYRPATQTWRVKYMGS